MSGLQYIPRHKRRQQADRLHGAFSGGFSAGYFNTVGSREGWQPRMATATAATGSDGGDNNYNDNHQQSIEDFMDEQDHNDWGGPRQVRPDLASGKSNNYNSINKDDLNDNDGSPNDEPVRKRAKSASSSSSLTNLLDPALTFSTSAVVLPQNVGQRLLRQLGWRGSGSGEHDSVYVPLRNPVSAAAATASKNNDDDDEEEEEETRLFLSNRRLQRIRLQQQKFAVGQGGTLYMIPPPKLDQTGLGFEAHKNAPEFQAYFQRQRRRHQKQQQQSSTSQNVYRVSNLLGGGTLSKDGTEKEEEEGYHPPDYYNTGPTNVATSHDFVGQTSASGFALDDDEDNVYDDDGAGNARNDRGGSLKKLVLDKSEYDTVIQDPHGSSEEEEEDDANNKDNVKRVAKHGKQSSHRQAPEASILGGALAAWATLGTATRGAADATATAMDAGKSNQTAHCHLRRSALDGRTILPGFVPAMGREAVLNQRFRGPDVPDGYDIRPHQFGPLERPEVLQVLARATQLERDDARRQAWMDQVLESAQVRPYQQQQKQRQSPFTDHRTQPFKLLEGLAQSMKQRFTSGTTMTSSPSSTQQEPQSCMGDSVANETKQGATKITVTRTIQSFAPLPLLCKRFGVPVPQTTIAMMATKPDVRGSEERFFEEQVLKAAIGAEEAAAAGARPKESPRSMTTSDMNHAVAEGPSRPPMEVYRSIFATNPNDDDDDNKSCASIPLDSGQNYGTTCDEPKSSTNGTKSVPDLDPENQQPAGNSSALVRYASRDMVAKTEHGSLAESSSDDDDDDSNSSNEEEDRKTRKARQKSLSKKHPKNEKRSRHRHHRRRRQRHGPEDDKNGDDDNNDHDSEAKDADSDRRRQRRKKHRKKEKSSSRKHSKKKKRSFSR